MIRVRKERIERWKVVAIGITCRLGFGLIAGGKEFELVNVGVSIFFYKEVVVKYGLSWSIWSRLEKIKQWGPEG